MVGGNSYDPTYVQRLRNLADQRVIFLGPVYGSGYWELLRDAGLYVFACEVGGVHPALIEAMAAQKPILYLDTPENRETAGDAAIPFRAGNLGPCLGDVAFIRGPPFSSRISSQSSRKGRQNVRLGGNDSKIRGSFSELLPANAPPPSWQVASRLRRGSAIYRWAKSPLIKFGNCAGRLKGRSANQRANSWSLIRRWDWTQFRFSAMDPRFDQNKLSPESSPLLHSAQ